MSVFYPLHTEAKKEWMIDHCISIQVLISSHIEQN